MVTPVTIPDELIVATPGAVLLQEPGAVASKSVVVVPVQTLGEPVMGAGNGFIVIVVVAKALPQLSIIE